MGIGAPGTSLQLPLLHGHCGRAGESCPPLIPLLLLLYSVALSKQLPVANISNRVYFGQLQQRQQQPWLGINTQQKATCGAKPSLPGASTQPCFQVLSCLCWTHCFHAPCFGSNVVALTTCTCTCCCLCCCLVCSLLNSLINLFLFSSLSFFYCISNFFMYACRLCMSVACVCLSPGPGGMWRRVPVGYPHPEWGGQVLPGC